MPGSLNKRKIKADAEEKNEDGHAHPKKKQRGAEEVKGNSKKSNPALIWYDLILTFTQWI